ncbi:MAG TPA: hypothetical protein VE623_09210 [Acidimicrobiales bacterium]|jgi:hypothetical protein|nr:hypothetical protein [Acidimicrobiales bacterium]
MVRPANTTNVSSALRKSQYQPPVCRSERSGRARESIGVLIAHLELDERPGLRLSCLNVTEIGSRDLRRRERNGVEDNADLQALRDQGPNHDHGQTIVSARSRPPVRFCANGGPSTIGT